MVATNSTRTLTSTEHETTSAGSTTPSVPTLSTAPSPAATPGLTSSVPSYIRPDDEGPSFSLNHLALMHHLERAKFAMLVGNEEEITGFFDMMFRTAYDVPYLMDEFLAFSALHLSTLHDDPPVKSRYRQQAAQLQTRALTQFNSMDPETRNGKVLAMFVFSSMLGLHTLFETGASFNGDLGDFLDSFIQYLTLHRGVQAVIRSNWDLIRNTEMKIVINPIEHYDRTNIPPGGLRAEKECAKLKDLVQGLSQSSGANPLVDTCLEGIKALEWVLERHSGLDLRYKAQAVSAWPIMLSAEFIELLKQRRPEALAISAHWAVVLHLNRQFWVYGDTGRILILAVTKHLGSYWDEWLAWPKEVLSDG